MMISLIWLYRRKLWKKLHHNFYMDIIPNNSFSKCALSSNVKSKIWFFFVLRFNYNIRSSGKIYDYFSDAKLSMISFLKRCPTQCANFIAKQMVCQHFPQKWEHIRDKIKQMQCNESVSLWSHNKIHDFIVPK